MHGKKQWNPFKEINGFFRLLFEHWKSSFIFITSDWFDPLKNEGALCRGNTIKQIYSSKPEANVKRSNNVKVFKVVCLTLNRTLDMHRLGLEYWIESDKQKLMRNTNCIVYFLYLTFHGNQHWKLSKHWKLSRSNTEANSPWNCLKIPSLTKIW